MQEQKDLQYKQDLQDIYVESIVQKGSVGSVESEKSEESVGSGIYAGIVRSIGQEGSVGPEESV